MPPIVFDLLPKKNRIDADIYKWLLRNTSIPWCMRARLINKYRKEQRHVG